MKSLDYKSRFEITICEQQELDPLPYTYKITANTSEQSLFNTNSFEILSEGIFSFSLYTENRLVGGFSIPARTLLTTCQFFPISKPLAVLQSLPQCDSGARVKLNIKEVDLYLVQESSEDSVDSSLTIFSRFKQELMQKDDLIRSMEKIIEDERSENDRLQHIVDELAENFYKFQSDHKDKVDLLLAENSESRTALNKALQEKLVLTEELKNLRRLVESLRGHRFELSFPEAPEVEAVSLRLRESETKRKELQQVLNSSNSKWLDARPLNNTLIYLEKENKTLISKVKVLTDQLNEPKSLPAEDENFMKYLHLMSSKLGKTKQKNKNLKGQLEACEIENSSYKEIVEKFRSEMSKQASENSELSEQLKSALGKIPHREEKVDQIDLELKQYFKDKDMKNPFVKISEGVYNYGNKRLCFNLKNGMPVVRVGGGYMFIDEFLKMYHTHCNKKKEEFPLRSQSMEGKGGSTLRVKQKSENDENRLNDTDSPVNRQEIKVLKKVPRKVFIP